MVANLHRRNEGAAALAGFKLSPVAIALLAEEEERGLAGCLLEGISSAPPSPREGLHGIPSSWSQGHPKGTDSMGTQRGRWGIPPQKSPKLFRSSVPAPSLHPATPYAETEMSAFGEGVEVLPWSQTE